MTTAQPSPRRASISVRSGTRAVRDSVRAAARAFLNPEIVKRPGN